MLLFLTVAFFKQRGIMLILGGNMNDYKKNLSDNYKEVGAELSDLFTQKREDKKLTVRELGEKADVSYTVIYDLEKRNILPKVETLLKLAEALDFIVNVKHSKDKNSKAVSIIFSEYNLSLNQEYLYNPRLKTPDLTIDEQIVKKLKKKGLYTDEIKEIQNYINFKLSQH